MLPKIFIDSIYAENAPVSVHVCECLFEEGEAENSPSDSKLCEKITNFAKLFENLITRNSKNKQHFHQDE